MVAPPAVNCCTIRREIGEHPDVPSIPSHELFAILATAEAPAPAAFAGEAGAACTAMALDPVDVTWLIASPALREIYVARRTLLAQRGVDVAGLDALLRHVDTTREGTRIGCFVVHAVDANLVGFFDERERRSSAGCACRWTFPPPPAAALSPRTPRATDGRTKRGAPSSTAADVRAARALDLPAQHVVRGPRRPCRFTNPESHVVTVQGARQL